MVPAASDIQQAPEPAARSQVRHFSGAGERSRLNRRQNPLMREVQNYS